MFFLSWLTARGSGTASVCLITLTDSPGRQFFCEAAVIKGRGVILVSCVCLLWRLPVRMDWSTRRVVDLMEMILMSAGTLSPTRQRRVALFLQGYTTNGPPTARVRCYNRTAA